MFRIRSRVFAASLLLAAAATAQAGDFRLASPEISAAKPLPQRFEFDGFGCSGQNRSPALRWEGAPAGTKSFAVTVYDPDAPTGSGWWHWVVVDLPADTTSLAPDAGAADGHNLPAKAMQVKTDFGTRAFGGACPPQGDRPHRYIFTVHALKVESLGVPADATAALAGFMIHANTLGSASFTVRYGRKR